MHCCCWYTAADDKPFDSGEFTVPQSDEDGGVPDVGNVEFVRPRFGTTLRAGGSRQEEDFPTEELEGTAPV